MSTGRHSFKLSDLKRAFRAARAEGVDVDVEITPAGGMKVISKQTTGKPETGNPWDTVLKDKAGKNAKNKKRSS